MEKEQLTIVPLTPERAEEYLHFFDTAFAGTGEWGHLCYCVQFCSTDNYNVPGFESWENRRKAAAEYIQKGFLKGYLAYAPEYEGGQVVGWCNANDRNACLKCHGMRSETYGGQCAPKADSQKGKSVFCFEVIPQMRGKGVASALLKRVIADAKEDGYDYVEVYPAKTEQEEASQYYYTGPRKFYAKFGFEQVGETERYLILRKNLL